MCAALHPTFTRPGGLSALPSTAFWTRTLTFWRLSSQSPSPTSCVTSVTSNSQRRRSRLRLQMHNLRTDSDRKPSNLEKLLKQVLAWRAEAGTVTGPQQTTFWWPVGNGWTRHCHTCQTDIRACWRPAYKVDFWPFRFRPREMQCCTHELLSNWLHKWLNATCVCL